MKVTILYRPNSEFARSVEEFAREFEYRHGITSEKVDIDSREGISLAAVYDIVSHPSIIVTRDGGEHIQHWTGTMLPTMSEVASYMRS